MTSRQSDPNRRRIAAGLLGKPEEEARAAARALSPAERKALAEQIEWVLKYEAYEAAEEGA